MRRIQRSTVDDAIQLADVAFALDIPPAAGSFALVPARWNGLSNPQDGVVPELDIEIWANATIGLTAAELFGAHAHPVADASLLVTPRAVQNDLTKTAHGYKTGDGPVRVIAYASISLGPLTAVVNTIIRATDSLGDGAGMTLALVADGVGVGSFTSSLLGKAQVFHFESGVTTLANFEAAAAANPKLAIAKPSTGLGSTLLTGADAFAAHVFVDAVQPGGVDPTVDYWLVAEDADHLQLATGLDTALLTTPVVDVTSVGAGAVIVALSASWRVHWQSHGLLGPAGDGAISLTDQVGYWTTRPHRSRVLAYGVKAALSASDPEGVSVAIWPTEDR